MSAAPYTRATVRKAFADRALRTYTRSRRFRAGSRRNKARRDVGSFATDKAAR